MSTGSALEMTEVVETAWRALVLAADGAPCHGPHADRWTSDDLEDRTAAAYQCAGCPAMDLCAAYAELAGERFHVWAGVDRTRRTGIKQEVA